jgi:hypothetical protein
MSFSPQALEPIKESALIFNIRIDQAEKLVLFKATLGDLRGLFEECHIRIRGAYSTECCEYARLTLGEKVNFYQDLREGRDWIASMLSMLENVRSRSVLLYLEDHKLVVPQERLKVVLREFNECKIDHLCYSFFRASQLDLMNILPLNPIHHTYFSEFKFDRRNRYLVGKISPKFSCYSLPSIASVRYLRALLRQENKKYKLYCKLISVFVTLLFPYPKYRYVFDSINRILKFFNARLLLSPIETPFNLEKNWYEALPQDSQWNFAILKDELFANFDDDNGAYGESLIKRGLYPFDLSAVEVEGTPSTTLSILLNSGEEYACTYFSRQSRISKPPRVAITPIKGDITVKSGVWESVLNCGQRRCFYTNIPIVITCNENAEIRLVVYDDAFGK